MPLFTTITSEMSESDSKLLQRFRHLLSLNCSAEIVEQFKKATNENEDPSRKIWPSQNLNDKINEFMEEVR